MEYKTTSEILGKQKENTRKILTDHRGKNIKDKIAIEIVKKHLKEKNAPILDLGAASGAFSEQLTESGYKNIYGVDIDNYLNEKYSKNLSGFKTANLNMDAIPWEENFFSLVTAWCVLPHLENPFHCVGEIHRILDSNGIFIFSIPHITSKPSIKYFLENNEFGSYKNSNNHIIIFTQAIIKKTILKYFDLVEIKYHIRNKIFTKGYKGYIRKLAYILSGYLSDKLTKKIEKRWAYNAIYVLRKK
ncbi:MAG: class I SAM-dependent methyltransferase [Patescibacteria group bacterium]